MVDLLYEQVMLNLKYQPVFTRAPDGGGGFYCLLVPGCDPQVHPAAGAETNCVRGYGSEQDYRWEGMKRRLGEQAKDQGRHKEPNPRDRDRRSNQEAGQIVARESSEKNETVSQVMGGDLSKT